LEFPHPKSGEVLSFVLD